MLTKAFIEEVISPYRYRVRIPLYDQIASVSTSTPKEELSIATVCGTPGTFYNYSVGDVVYVMFEDNERENVVILGSLLYKDTQTVGLTTDNITTNEFHTNKLTIDNKSIDDIIRDKVESFRGNLLSSDLCYAILADDSTYILSDDNGDLIVS